MNAEGLLAVISMLGATIQQLQERNAQLETAVAQLSAQPTQPTPGDEPEA